MIVFIAVKTLEDLIYFVALFFSSSRIGGNNFTSCGGVVIAKALKHNTRLKVIG